MTDQTHYLPCSLKFGGHDTWAYFSVRPKGTAIVFVHGFTGSAVDTWSEFDRLLLEEPKCAGADLFFVGYESVRITSSSAASVVHEILQTLYSDPESLQNWPLRRGNLFVYSRFLIVAHSLGAVVSRRAILMGHARNEEWPSKCRLILYAPAHFGARLQRLLTQLLPKKWIALLYYTAPTIEELKPNSETLRKLKEHTQKAVAGGADYLKAIKVVQARSDNIIIDKDEVFCGDEHSDWVDGTHLTVCKPRAENLNPLRHLLSKL
jgi:triacylglycerol esterase/lipase EstA (alpha/beta hydrolase family)